MTDSLGRLTQVIEAPNDSNYNYQTTYSYDAVGNLSTVTQGVQHRYFMYDSLSRLIRAKNPEQDANTSLALSDPVSGNSQAISHPGPMPGQPGAQPLTPTTILIVTPSSVTRTGRT